jgi:hypothetical protein
MRPTERLLARLREAGMDLPEGVTIQRTYAGREQRNAGAWSWALLGPNGEDLKAGSQWPVGDLLRHGFDVSGPGHRDDDTHIDKKGLA